MVIYVKWEIIWVILLNLSKIFQDMGFLKNILRTILFFLETGRVCLCSAGCNQFMAILLPQLLQCWHYRHAAPCPAMRTIIDGGNIVLCQMTPFWSGWTICKTEWFHQLHCLVMCVHAAMFAQRQDRLMHLSQDVSCCWAKHDCTENHRAPGKQASSFIIKPQGIRAK